jgi:hypothetical protein
VPSKHVALSSTPKYCLKKKKRWVTIIKDNQSTFNVCIEISQWNPFVQQTPFLKYRGEKTWLNIEFWIENNFTSKIGLQILLKLRSAVLLWLLLPWHFISSFFFLSMFCSFMMIHFSMYIFSSNVPGYVPYWNWSFEGSSWKAFSIYVLVISTFLFSLSSFLECLLCRCWAS